MTDPVAETQAARQAKLYRNLFMAAGFLALVGWGTAYAARSSAAVRDQLRNEIAQLRANQDQLVAEQKQQQATIEDLVRQRDQAKAQAEAVQQELAAVREQLEEARAKLSETSVRAPAAPSEPARSPAQTKRWR